VQEIRDWVHRPYLLGEPQQPRCTNCQRSGGWADVCSFKAGDNCEDWHWQPIKDAWLERGYDLALTFTPCDLWPLIRGRTLWLVGDSQMLDFFKARPPLPGGGFGCARAAAGIMVDVDCGQVQAGLLCPGLHWCKLLTMTRRLLSEFLQRHISLKLQAAKCFLYEFWPSLELRNVTADATVQERLSTLLPAWCVHMLQGTAVCFVRADEVGPGSGAVSVLASWVGRMKRGAVLSWSCNPRHACKCTAAVPSMAPFS
jgi:hypothetical protein